MIISSKNQDYLYFKSKPNLSLIFFQYRNQILLGEDTWQRLIQNLKDKEHFNTNCC